MTVHELTKSISSENLSRLMAVGIVSKTAQRNIEMYEAYCDLIQIRTPAMQAYIEISERFSVSDEYVRTIVRKFRKPVI